MSIDGTHFPIVEPWPFSKKWFSHKFKGPGLTYEIALALRSSDIVWVHGGYPEGSHTDDVLVKTAFVHMLIPNYEHVIANEGYRGIGFFVIPKKK